MTIDQQPEKPKNVRRAEWILWGWTAFTCLLGSYQTWASIPELEKALMDQAQGQVLVSPDAMLAAGVGGYLLVAATSAWIILRIAEGKNWARLSLLLGLVVEILWTAVFFPSGISEYLSDALDFGLQIYAVYLLYTRPGSGWFLHKNA